MVSIRLALTFRITYLSPSISPVSFIETSRQIHILAIRGDPGIDSCFHLIYPPYRLNHSGQYLHLPGTILLNWIVVSISMMSVYLGVSIAAASWLFLLITVITFFLQLHQAKKEERYCCEKFDDAYREYMRRTPRWIGIPKSITN